MKLGVLLAGLTILLSGATLPAQISTDVIGVHNLGPNSKSPITGARPDACAYCHAPHSGLNAGLWNQKLTTQSYTTYTSDTEKNTGRQPTLGYSTNQCLSCHDGTVAVGTTVAYGQVTMRGSMNTWDVFGSNMQSSHPFSLVLPLKDNVDLMASLAANGRTGDATGAVKLIKGNVECTSCHNPHVQAKDLISQNFLVKDSSSGQRRVCCAVRMSRIALPATTARTSLRWRLTPTCFQSMPRLKSDIHFPLRLIPTMPLRAYCSTTTAMLLAWTAIMPMGPKWSGHFLFRR